MFLGCRFTDVVLKDWLPPSLRPVPSPVAAPPPEREDSTVPSVLEELVPAAGPGPAGASWRPLPPPPLHHGGDGALPPAGLLIPANYT